MGSILVFRSTFAFGVMKEVLIKSYTRKVLIKSLNKMALLMF